MNTSEYNAVQLNNYMEAIRGFHENDERRRRAQTWQVILVATLLVALGVPILLG